MTHYLIELALWLLLAYGLGCIIGSRLRHWLAKPGAAEPES